MAALRRVRRALRQVVWFLGFQITREPNLQIRLRRESYGVDPLADIQRFLKPYKAPVICDVGANEGQSVRRFCEMFPRAEIHSFEPSPTTYEILAAKCHARPKVTTWNVALGADPGSLDFKENTHSDMSSFLSPSGAAWGEVVRTSRVAVTTLDAFAEQQQLPFIHLVKSDTQGFELEVFKGARKLMAQGRILLIFCEVIFSDMYEGLPRFHEILKFMEENGFTLVGVYEQHFKNGIVSWADVLFVSNDCANLLSATTARNLEG
jgi:FkbM family methyltransferase